MMAATGHFYYQNYERPKLISHFPNFLRSCTPANWLLCYACFFSFVLPIFHVSLELSCIAGSHLFNLRNLQCFCCEYFSIFHQYLYMFLSLLLTFVCRFSLWFRCILTIYSCNGPLIFKSVRRLRRRRHRKSFSCASCYAGWKKEIITISSRWGNIIFIHFSFVP